MMQYLFWHLMCDWSTKITGLKKKKKKLRYISLKVRSCLIFLSGDSRQHWESVHTDCIRLWTADMISGVRMKRNAGRLCGKIIVKFIESLPCFLSALLLCLPETTTAKSCNISFLDFQIVSERKTYTGTSVCLHTHSPGDNNCVAAAKSLQSCPTLHDPIDGSPPGSPVPGILQARTLEWVAISFSDAWKWIVKVKSLSPVRLLATPWTAAHQAPPSMGFSRQEYWSGVPLPSPNNCVSRFYFLLNLYLVRLLHFYLMRKAYLLKTEIGFYFPLTQMLHKN